MKLLTPDIQARLLENGRKQAPVRGTKDEIDFLPVVKLFTPDAGCNWLLTEIDPDDTDVYLSRGHPKLGSVRLSEIAAVHGKLGLPAERDLWFEADKPLSAYAKEAARRERKVESEFLLNLSGQVCSYPTIQSHLHKIEAVALCSIPILFRRQSGFQECRGCSRRGLLALPQLILLRNTVKARNGQRFDDGFSDRQYKEPGEW